MKKTKIIACVAACLAIITLMSACERNNAGSGAQPEADAMATPDNEDSESDGQSNTDANMTGRLYFGNDKNKALLIDDSGSLLWIYPVKDGMLDPYNTGDKVTVTHGPVALSLPGQTNISSVSLISDGDESVFCDEELEEIMKVIDGFR